MTMGCHLFFYCFRIIIKARLRRPLLANVTRAFAFLDIYYTTGSDVCPDSSRLFSDFLPFVSTSVAVCVDTGKKVEAATLNGNNQAEMVIQKRGRFT